jgi:hypothetical protein
MRMNQPAVGPLGRAAGEIQAARQFLEVPYKLTAEDWREGFDGLRQVLFAAEQLAATLAGRGPQSAVEPQAAEALDAVHDLLGQANTMLVSGGDLARQDGHLTA